MSLCTVWVTGPAKMVVPVRKSTFSCADLTFRLVGSGKRDAKFSKYFPIGVVHFQLKAAEYYPFNRGLMIDLLYSCFNCDPGGLLSGIAVDAAANRGKSDALDLIVQRELQAGRIARRKQLRLS